MSDIKTKWTSLHPHYRQLFEILGNCMKKPDEENYATLVDKLEKWRIHPMELEKQISEILQE